MKSIKFLLVMIVFGFHFLPAQSDEARVRPKVGLEQHLGIQIPLDLVFTDSKGARVRLGDFIDRPTVLSLVYYHCPGICSPLLTGLSDAVDKSGMTPGKEFKVLTISFDHAETYDKAAKWKFNYLSSMKIQFDPEKWKFMVGDSLSIDKISDAVGFYFMSDGKDDFVHTATIIILSPTGHVVRYLTGTEFLPADFKMAIKEAAIEKVTPSIPKLVQFCFSYDPSSNKYVLNANMIVGSIVLIGAGSFFIFLMVNGRKKKVNKGEKNA